MPGTDAGNGLADAKDGYRLIAKAEKLAAGNPTTYRFSIVGPDDNPVTEFAVDQTKRMHFYVVRFDLTGFQHLHPTMAANGAWAVDLAALTPGAWRAFASFTPGAGPGNGKQFVLSRAITVPGTQKTTPLPAAATSTTVDGYTVKVTGKPMADMAHPLTVTITNHGRPVTDLEPYLDTYAHLTAFHQGDTAFAHLHPTTKVNDNGGGPKLSFHAELPDPGNWRLYLQFQTAGKLHTAALTLHVS